MADAMVERRPPPRFFCHRCLVEFQDVEQDYMCPYCEGGFIEQLEEDAEGPVPLPRDDYSDADMSNIDDMTVDELALDDSDEFHTSTPPMLNDLAFLMSGDQRVRNAIANAVATTVNGTSNNIASFTSTITTTPSSGNTTTISNSNPQRGPTLQEELLWLISGGRPPAGAMTAGAPFVLVGTPGDYVFGGEGLDAVVTQLLGQLEHTGPPPLPRERLAALPTQQVTAEQAAANTACSVCWENFELDETVSRLECEHIFHQSCITPWLELHATCPICRRSLLPPDAPPSTTASTTASTTTTTATTGPPPATTAAHHIRLGTPLSSLFVNAAPHIVIQRRTGALPTLIRRIPSQTHTWDSLNDTSTSGSMSPASSVTTGGIWAAQNRSSSSTGSTNSSTSLNSNDRDRQYNTDMDYD
ncbi:E3 ubiquitin-protein ligase RNF115 [Maniola jurtina]|uniref:E3 ubiquitin-protein ligase RNF115 n=1 Tax=Maniola jurtina TaxID=191418 RepID=UPI001E68BE1F|nr:E3 ubiquitin-protein ligase RNF115 [Maniola jurtina]